LCLAIPKPESREDWRLGVCALAYLVAGQEWPESEARKIREAWESLAENADTTNNVKEWQEALKSSSEK